MKIKTKLRFGFGFLFLIVLIFGAISLWSLQQISGNASLVLKDNYESLGFTRDMRLILDEDQFPLNPAAKARFEQQLRQERANITEKGEQQAVTALQQAYAQLIHAPAGGAAGRQALYRCRLQLRKIEALNMQAIVRKDAEAREGVKKAVIYLSTTAACCFLILFSFVVNFPGFVADPLREFAAAIRQIGRKNYKQELHFEGTDEFAELAAAFNAMSAQLNAWENSNLAGLQSEKLRIEAIIEQLQDAIIGIDELQKVLFLNPVAARLLNLDEKEVTGKDAAVLLEKNDLLKSILQTENTTQPLKIYADQKESYFQLEKREIMVADNPDSPLHTGLRSAGQVYLLKNITRFKELDEAKTNFIATVSHELKTPIAAIKLSLKLLDDSRVGAMNAEQAALVRHMQEDCGRLLKITTELLNLAQAETGNLQLNFVQTPPLKIVQYAIEAVRFQAGQKSVQLVLEHDAQLPEVNADMEKTAWVLINFLSNGLRYSTPGSKIIIGLHRRGQQVEFAVQDFGQGIEARYQEKLFDRYFQVPADGHNKSGTGLGLAISRDFIQAENGRIWVESAIGEGSRFCFSLPGLL